MSIDTPAAGEELRQAIERVGAYFDRRCTADYDCPVPHSSWDLVSAALLAARREVEAARAALLAIADAQREWTDKPGGDDETFQFFSARLQSLARTGLANRLRAALAATPEENA